ncbi:hypothetical protein SRHO_G00246750 [Serrasalmus rhombeus]
MNVNAIGYKAFQIRRVVFGGSSEAETQSEVKELLNVLCTDPHTNQEDEHEFFPLRFSMKLHKVDSRAGENQPRELHRGTLRTEPRVVFGGSSEAETQSEVKELNERCPVSSLLLPLPTRLKCASLDATGHSTKRKVKLLKQTLGAMPLPWWLCCKNSPA